MNANQDQFRAALAAAYADLFANNAEYAYSASKTTPAQLADKMLAAAISGSINKDGEGVKRACKACGIPYTLKAIFAFVGYEKPAPIAPEVSTGIGSKTRKTVELIIPKIVTMMTGVWRIQKAHDLVKLTYTDNTTEAGFISLARWLELGEDGMKIVSEIQAQRKPANVSA
jgi:hypothetical protein